MILEEHIKRLKEALDLCPTEHDRINIKIEGYLIDDLIHYLEELEVHKTALDWLAGRCEVLDKIANPTLESICFKAKRWKEISLQKARKQE